MNRNRSEVFTSNPNVDTDRAGEIVQAASPRSLKQLLAWKTAEVIQRFSCQSLSIKGVIPVLCYHRVLPSLPGAEPSAFAVTPEQFESQLVFLLEHGFCSLSLEEFKDMARGRMTPTRPSVLITFDDGYYDNFAIAWPIAQKYGIKINIFALTGLAGKDGPVIIGADTRTVRAQVNRFPELWRMMNWRELRSMQEAGVGIGLHGHTHRRMSSWGKEAIAKELELATLIFRKELGARPWAFAIPYGNPGTFTTEVLKVLKSLGLEMVFSTLSGRTHLPEDDLPIRRLVISSYDDLRFFEMKVSGALDWLGHIRALEQRVRNLFELIPIG
jgi:peptidoglycan/xylan/chitin deacetylase (PgdA/CDA1 family)